MRGFSGILVVAGRRPVTCDEEETYTQRFVDLATVDRRDYHTRRCQK